MQLLEELLDVDFVELLQLDEQQDTTLSEALQLEELDEIEIFEELLLDESTDGGELLDFELLELTLEWELTDSDKEDDEQEKLGRLDELLEELSDWDEKKSDEDDLLEDAELQHTQELLELELLLLSLTLIELEDELLLT